MSSSFGNTKETDSSSVSFYWTSKNVSTLRKLKEGERGRLQHESVVLCLLPAFLNTINNVSTCCPDQKRGQILCISLTLHWIGTFGCSGTAAKELHVLYTKISGSYFNLWELDAFCTTNASLSIQWGVWVWGERRERERSSLTNHNNVLFLHVEFNQILINYTAHVWQAIDCVRIYLGLRRLTAARYILLMFKQQKEAGYWVLIAGRLKSPECFLYFYAVGALGSHLPRRTFTASCKRPQLMRANPSGNSRGHFKSGIFRLDKGLKFLYIPALPSCFNGMNEGHLK